MRRIKQNLKTNQRGFSLIELVVAITIMGVALPAIFSLYASISARSSQSAVMDQMVALAQNKMEEIIAKKESDWTWYQDPTQFEVTENLPDHYTRSVSVTTVSNWGNAGIDAWQVTVQVGHPQMTNPYQLVTRFSKYEE